jgi:DNA-binding ferritin-like protein
MEDTLTPVQQVIDAIREKVVAAYDDEEIDLGTRAFVDDILDQIEEEGWK